MDVKDMETFKDVGVKSGRRLSGRDRILVLGFAVVILLMPLWLKPFGADYPDLLQKFAIFGLFAVGFNLLFGLTGYLSFGHAAFIGIGSYTALWSFKLLSMNALLAVVFAMAVTGVFALAIGFIALRRSGIYFSILTLAFAQMCYNLAYSVLTPVTNGETGLQLEQSDPRFFDSAAVGDGLPLPDLFGAGLTGYSGFYFCAVVLIIGFYVSVRLVRSPFGLMLKALKSNQNRMKYTGFDTRPYLLSVFVISGVYAGLAGALMVVIDPLAGAERMQWTASGEVVLMTILGGVGTLLGPVIGAVIIKYCENIFSAFNQAILMDIFSFLPDFFQGLWVSFVGLFVGSGWHLTLGLLFMLVVIFLPGGVMEGCERLAVRLGGLRGRRVSPVAAQGGEREPKQDESRGAE